MEPVQNNLLQNGVQSALIISLAMLAGSKRLIQYFPGVSQNGLRLSAALGTTAIIGTGFSREEKECVQDNLIRTVGSLALVTILTPFVSKALKGRADITFQSSFRLFLLQAGICTVYTLISSCTNSEAPPPQPTIQEKYTDFVKTPSQWENLSSQERLALAQQFCATNLALLPLKDEDFSEALIASPVDYSTLSKVQLEWHSHFFIHFKTPTPEEWFALNTALQKEGLPMVWDLPTKALIDFALNKQAHVDLLHTYYLEHPIVLRAADHDTIQLPLITRFQTDKKSDILGIAPSAQALSAEDVAALNRTFLISFHASRNEGGFTKRKWSKFSLSIQEAFNTAFAKLGLAQI